jgi:hypothetical protein
MSSLLSFYLKKETLETMLKVVNQKNDKGVEMTISINEEANQYGQNVSGWVSQTEEQRKAKKERFFTGNGKVFWTDGIIKVAAKEQQNERQPDNEPESDDLPF